MAETQFGQALLDAIAQLGNKVDARFDKVDARFDKVDARLDAHDERLMAIEGRLTRIEKQIAEFRLRLDGLEENVAELRREIKSGPDLHFLTASARMHIDRTIELQNEIHDMKIRLDEIFKSMATDPEIKSLRSEVSNFRAQSLEFDLRLRTIEARLKAGTPLLAPTP